MKKPMPNEEAEPVEEAPEEGAAPGLLGDEEPPMDGEPMGEEQPNVSPEEQKQYEQFVDNCYSIIYDQKTLPKILKSLNATDDPKMNLANTIVMVVKFVSDSAKGAGQNVSVDVLMHGGAEVMADLADLAAKVQIHEYSQDEIEGATYIAMDLYREMQKSEGTLDEEGSKEDIRMALQAQQEGRLDDVIPGASERAGPPPAEGEPMEDEPVEEEEPAEEEDE